MEKHACSNGLVLKKSLYPAILGVSKNQICSPILSNKETIEVSNIIVKSMTGNKSLRNSINLILCMIRFIEMLNNADNIGLVI